MAEEKQVVSTSGISKETIQKMFRIGNLNYAEVEGTLYALKRMNSFYWFNIF